MESDALSPIGGRKFVLACLILALAYTLALFRILDVEKFMDFAKLVFGVYAGANLATKVTDIFQK